MISQHCFRWWFGATWHLSQCWPKSMLPNGMTQPNPYFLAATRQLYDWFSPSVCVVLEDRLYYWKSTVLLEDLLWCWKMNGRSKVLLENQLYWRQSTRLDGNYRSRKITTRIWLHKYVGAECGASSFTWYLYQMCNTDVRLSVFCLSVCPAVTPFSPCSHHRMIMTFSGVISMVRSNVHAKCQGQRSKVKVTEVNTQLSRFRTLTPVWIHIWQWNHAHSWKRHRRGALLFFKVILQISRSHGSKNGRIWPRLGVSGL